jgi:hypothetical protein
MMRDKNMKNRIHKPAKGAVLPAVVIITLIVIIIGFSLLEIARTEIVLTQKSVSRVKAFYLAEAGLANLVTRLYNREFDSIEQTSLNDGSYRVDVNCNQNPSYAISTGRIGNETKRIKVQISFLAAPFENCIYAANHGGGNWTLALRGKGNPALSGGREIGGKDIINGNLSVNGDAALYEQSGVNPAPAPNTHNLQGDVEATGSISVSGSAHIAGQAIPNAEAPDPIDLIAMKYQTNNTHDVSKIFETQGINQGHLPSWHDLYNVVEKNPSDRSTECSSTAGNDYFFEPTGGFSNTGGEKGAATPLHLGENRIYYVDGDVWIHSKETYGFLVDGKVTIVVTGNIHICDNILYANADSILGLVALGRYDSSGNLISGGNIYFGDPRYGTMYTISAMMFAGNSFLYNTDFGTGKQTEPTTGFSVYGNFAALNKVTVYRDWYTDVETNKARPAYFDPGTGQWLDRESKLALTAGEVGTMRHYQMKVNYDDRVRNTKTQPPGLPRGCGVIFSGLSHWEELS